MQFSRFEKLASTGAIVVALAGIGGLVSHQTTADDLIRSGQCEPATIVDSSHFGSLRIGRWATVSYTRNGVSYTETLHYDDVRLVAHSKLELCTRSEDPRYFASQVDGLTGTSTQIWLRTEVGGWSMAAAFAALVILMSSHQWRFREDEEP